MKNIEQVFVFRTNVGTKRMALRVCHRLKKEGLVRRATIDMEDYDRVLRAESSAVSPEYLVRTVAEMGVQIEELH